mmetsp:Transcript_26688/g.58097  ORF Transcript_26688/g.58097 Transcript_26688/m.58097 type:complete len:772 (-) Transcript_26688:298-2613(-)
MAQDTSEVGKTNFKKSVRKVQHIKAFRGADAPRGAPSNIAAYDADDFCALLSWILRNQTRDQHLESVERCRGLTNQHNPSRDINMGLLAKGGGAAGLLTLLDQCKSNDSELTTKILYVLCDMANAYKLFTNKSIYGALFVDLGLIRTCMQLISNTRPALASSFATQSSISASTRDNADLVVRTLYPLLILKKDTTIEFFREDGLRVFINLVNAKPRSQATHLALKFFNLLNGLYPGFQEIFRKVEGVEAVASVLTSCAVESESVEEALILLLTYTQSNVGAKTLISTGSIPAVLDIFRQSIAVGGARSKATALALKMISLLGRLSNNCRTMLRDNGVVEVLIELCQEEHAAGRLTSSIVLLSLEALFFLSANNAPIRCAIRKSDGIPMLLDVMAECANCTVRHHWKYALFVLQELAFSCEEARQVVTDLEVIPMLVQLLLKQEEKMTRDLPESRDAEGRRDGLESGLDETAIAAKAAALLEEMRSAGIPRTVTVYTALIGAYGASGRHWRCAEEAWRAMQREGLRPDRVAHNTMIATLRDCGQCRRAMQVWREMKAAQIAPDVVTYNTLISVHGRAGQWWEAQALADEMISVGVTPDEVTYTSLLVALADADQTAEAVAVLKGMHCRWGLSLTASTAAIVMRACARSGAAGHAQMVLRTMAKEGVPLDGSILSSALTAWKNAGLLGEGVTVLLGELVDRRTPLDEALFPTLFCICLHMEMQDHHELAKLLAKEVQHAGEGPDSELYSLLVMVYAKCKGRDGARALASESEG